MCAFLLDNPVFLVISIIKKYVYVAKKTWDFFLLE